MWAEMEAGGWRTGGLAVRPAIKQIRHVWRFFPSPEEGSGLSAAIDLVSPGPTADLMADRPLCFFSVLSSFSDLDLSQPPISPVALYAA